MFLTWLRHAVCTATGYSKDFLEEDVVSVSLSTHTRIQFCRAWQGIGPRTLCDVPDDVAESLCERGIARVSVIEGDGVRMLSMCHSLARCR